MYHELKLRNETKIRYSVDFVLLVSFVSCDKNIVCWTAHNLMVYHDWVDVDSEYGINLYVCVIPNRE